MQNDFLWTTEDNAVKVGDTVGQHHGLSAKSWLSYIFAAGLSNKREIYVFTQTCTYTHIDGWMDGRKKEITHTSTHPSMCGATNATAICMSHLSIYLPDSPP